MQKIRHIKEKEVASMDGQNGMMTLKMAKQQYLRKARELWKSRGFNLNAPDYIIQDEIGEMSLSLIELYQKDKGIILTQIERIKLRQQILLELDGEKEPEFLKVE